MVLTMVHVFELRFDNIESKQDELSATQRFLFYLGFELIAACVFLLSKTTEDLFMELNRDRQIMKYSIYQYNHIEGVKRDLLSKLHLNGNN